MKFLYVSALPCWIRSPFYIMVKLWSLARCITVHKHTTALCKSFQTHAKRPLCPFIKESSTRLPLWQMASAALEGYVKDTDSARRRWGGGGRREVAVWGPISNLYDAAQRHTPCYSPSTSTWHPICVQRVTEGVLLITPLFGMEGVLIKPYPSPWSVWPRRMNLSLPWLFTWGSSAATYIPVQFFVLFCFVRVGSSQETRVAL